MMDKSSNIKYPEVKLKDVVSYLWQGIKGSRLAMFLAVAGVAVASAFEIIAPLYYKRFFDLLSSGQDKNIIVPQLIHILFITLGIAGASWLGWRLGSFAGVSFQAKAMASLRRQSYNHLIHHSYSFFANNFAGALVQRVGRYARSFERFTDRIIWSLVPLLVRLIGIVIVTLTIESRLTILIVSWTLIYMATNYFYSSWKLKYNLRAAEADSQTTAVLADTIANQNNIDIFSRHEKEKDNFRKVTADQKKIVAFNWNVDLGLDAIQSAFIIFIEFAIFFLAIRYWQIGVVTLGTFVLVQMYVLGLGSRLWEFSRIVRDFYSSYADTKEMVEIMKLPYEIINLPDAKPLKVLAGEVIFDNVSFAFSDGNNQEVLKNINIKVTAGEKVALVGPSGSGKTTLVRLLLRLYDVVSGKILIDDQGIKEVTLESLRSNISLVPQDPILFHRTIMENIRYGREGATNEEVLEAARLAHCDEFVGNLNQKYETYVGERGIKLSGGERQRVAIARAILKNAPILILDEATSSLDSRSESFIQDALDVLMKEKTVIVIAHRLSTIRKMNRIVVLEKGSIKETGTHEELIAMDTLYKKLWTLQAGGFIKNGS